MEGCDIPVPPVEPQPSAEPCSAVGAGPRYVKPAKTWPLAATKPPVTSPPGSTKGENSDSGFE